MKTTDKKFTGSARGPYENTAMRLSLGILQGAERCLTPQAAQQYISVSLDDCREVYSDEPQLVTRVVAITLDCASAKGLLGV